MSRSEPLAATPTGPPLPAEALTFDVTLDGGVLHVVGVLPAGAHVATDDDTNAWVSAAAVRSGDGWRSFEPTALGAAERVVPACGAALCAVRYDFALP